MRTVTRWFVTALIWMVTVIPVGVLVDDLTQHAINPLLLMIGVSVAWAFAVRVIIARLFDRDAARSRGADRYVPPVRPSAPPVPHRGPVDAPGRRIYGDVAGKLGQTGGFTSEAVSAGRDGEVATARVIEPWMKQHHPDGYVFHGLSWPGSANADIDHAILVRSGRRDLIVCLDSKRWKRGAYGWDGRTATRDGVPTYEVKFGNAVDAMARTYPQAQVVGVVVQTLATSVRDTSRGTTRMVSLNDLPGLLSALIGSGDKPVSPQHVQQLINQLK